MNRRLNRLLVTGGSGFIGSNFIRFMLNNEHFSGQIVNLDKLTYAGNNDSLRDIESQFLNKRYFFHKGDICNRSELDRIFNTYQIDTVIHFAAESHVDRSISGPSEFIQTNIVGTFTLLEAARKFWQSAAEANLFHHVSTDEVYGSLGETGYFSENTAYDPRSPYSASKASSDHLVKSYFHTYGLPVTLSNCSNNYGPFHFPEKLIPLMILNAVEGTALPVYGDGKNVRDWLYVEDHAKGIWEILKNGQSGETYNLGGDAEKTNIEVVMKICDILESTFPAADNVQLRAKKLGSYRELISYVKDRPGHDRRYAVDFEKIRNQLGWKPATDFEEGLEKTIQWYLNHMDWVDRIRSGAYQEWIDTNYVNR